MKAFTLLELSISLIIIALITGSIVSGEYLYKQYLLRTVINESNYYKSAINSFKLQYGQLPGDFNGASNIWPTCDATPANCNGNNNGVILISAASQYADEALRAWQHLYLAGFIDQKMSGYHNVASTNTIGTNVPSSKFPGAGWHMQYINTACATFVYLVIGGYIPTTYNNAPVMTPLQALSIDQKIDDGFPLTGKVTATRTDATVGCFGGYPVGQTCVTAVAGIYNNVAPYYKQVHCPISFSYY